jgi:ABC-2 type transport system permease protein
MQGDAWWFAAIVPGVVLSSLGLGLVMSTYSSTESQAVQWSMLSLLAGLFFGGFILRVEDLAYPVRAISWLLPVTYGIRALQDVMLRGVDPSVFDIGGLAALSVGYGIIAIAALRRELRPA